ncbi:MAG: M15 family metallopeptidase [Prevotella sp.]|nr:M15 family metallopeptidase [Prevotella sp.]MEE1092980.1 M15 family metallopeptidase [Prevotella sp.]
MNKSLIIFLSIVFWLGAVQCESRTSQKNISHKDSTDTTTVCQAQVPEAPVMFPPGVIALQKAYPDFVKGYEDGMLLLADNTKMRYDDGVKKSFTEMLDNSDPQDMFELEYNKESSSPGYLQDAGRSRCDLFFKKMYGSSASSVRQHLVSVQWFGGKVQFTKLNGAADSLRAVYKELANHPDLRPYLKSSGTFYWRKVRGANRQSAHSYGIAIDVGVALSDYWLWKYPGKKETDKIQYHNRMPLKMVEIFERHGFIWGGRWYHFDTMHFEFRPEILMMSDKKNNK